MFQTERHFIMQVVCEATQCPDTRVSNVSMVTDETLFVGVS